MDEVGYEIQMLNEQKTKHMAPVEKEIQLLRMFKLAPVEKEIQLLRMFKSDLRNIVKRYEKLELLIN